jgi:hypothetical protein
MKNSLKIFVQILATFLFMALALHAKSEDIKKCYDIQNNKDWTDYVSVQESKNNGVIEQLLTFHKLREQRDMPNSMASSIDPSVRSIELNHKLKDALGKVRKLPQTEVNPIVDCMFIQRSDESLVRTSIELGIKQSKNYSRKLRQLAKKFKEPEKAKLIDEVKENIANNS